MVDKGLQVDWNDDANQPEAKLCYRCGEGKARLCIGCANDLQDAGQSARTIRIEALATQSARIEALRQALGRISKLYAYAPGMSEREIVREMGQEARRALRGQGAEGAVSTDEERGE